MTRFCKGPIMEHLNISMSLTSPCECEVFLVINSIFFNYNYLEWWRKSKDWKTRWIPSVDSELESIQVSIPFQYKVSINLLCYMQYMYGSKCTWCNIHHQSFLPWWRMGPLILLLQASMSLASTSATLLVLNTRCSLSLYMVLCQVSLSCPLL